MTVTPSHPGRRRFVQGLALVGGVGAAGYLPGRAMAQGTSPSVLAGAAFDLHLGETPINITGRRRIATAVNGLVPGPTLRWREGDDVTLTVANRLTESSSIHWHGVRLPADMDGVPGLSFRGIAPGETFTYRLPIRQAGTYWYHSHSGMQEQTGLYGAIVIDPKGVEPHPFDREHVLLLSDWTDEDPMAIVANLKQDGSYYNYNQRTVGDLARDVKRDGLTHTLKQRAMWATMRMTPTDLEDVGGATYTYLVNGAPPRANWTGLFKPGERVRLRVINGSSMTIFDLRIPGLKMSVVQTDGYDVHPVEVDEFRIGVAETYDVIVTPTEPRAYTVFAQSLGRTGFARATLAPRLGMSAPVPIMDPAPARTMTDMGMSMAGMDAKGMDMKGMEMRGGAMPAMQMGGTPPLKLVASPDSLPSMGGMAMNAMAARGGMDRPAPTPGAIGHGDMAAMDMKGMAMPAPAQSSAAAVAPMTTADATDSRSKVPVADASDVAPSDMKGAVNVDNVAMETKNRLGEAGDGLDGNGRRVLTYTDLRALAPGPDPRLPTREIVFHLTGNMQRWTWGFDGKKFSEAPPIHLNLGERVRFILVNDTMMEHPIHLHGLFSQIENGQGEYSPLKHTVTVKPGERMSYLVSADTPGHWAFHCHLLYHMETGMFRTVVVA